MRSTSHSAVVDAASPDPLFAVARALLDELEPLPATLRANRLADVRRGNALAADLASRMLQCLDGGPFARPMADVEGSFAGVEAEFNAAHAPDRSPALPDFGPRYRVLGYLGRGGVGEVFRAREMGAPHREVALKLVAWTHLSPADLHRFTREAMALGRLTHTGVAQIHEAGATPDGRMFIAMEFVDGAQVDRWLQDRSPPFSCRMALFDAVCRAVEHAHQRGVVHRDLKPSNILVPHEHAQAEAPAAKVIDFGIARLTDDTGPAQAAVTVTGQVVGTLEYMSPEQRRGAREADTRMDVYALGALLHLLATDQAMPLAGEAGARAIERRVATSPWVPRARRAGLAAIIVRATEAERDDRYPSVTALCQDADRLQRDLPLEARPPSPAARVAMLARRRPRTTALVATLGLVTLGAIAALAHSRNQQALTARQLATELEAQSRQTLAMVDDVLDRLDSVLGATAPRQALALSLLARTQDLRHLSPDDPALQQAEARIHMALGDIELDAGRPVLAQERFGQASAELHRLAAAQPSDLALARAAARALVRVGDAQWDLPDPAAARATWRQAFEAAQAIAQRWPHSVEALDDLTWSYDRLWSDEAVLRDPEGTLALVRERQELARKLLALQPDRALTLLTLMEGHYRLAITLHRLDRLAEALTEARHAVELGRDLVAREPGRIHARITLGNCLARAAALAELNQRMDEQRALVDELAALTAGTLAAEPANRMAFEQHVASLHERAMLARALALQVQGAQRALHMEQAAGTARQLLTEVEAWTTRTGATPQVAATLRDEWRVRLANPDLGAPSNFGR